MSDEIKIPKEEPIPSLKSFLRKKPKKQTGSKTRKKLSPEQLVLAVAQKTKSASTPVASTRPKK
ncbi:MAG: hypothetical protein IH623_32400 [Verrucomicrobia bacterium]|nr:hypothetical protein [Verrucomicrobiota bacterium]